MIIADLDFPDELLDALRDNRLVVFAGAGVSMGKPACLPSFAGLADCIAEGTTKKLEGGEPIERFLGRLHQDGVTVHERAKDCLTQTKPQPTQLHKDLLQLYKSSNALRLVTTNFDTLFEDAAKTVFSSHPRVFNAPALPLGDDFAGIAHLHGIVHQSQNMVLTEGDFGRAYMTQNWASRFLLDLFQSSTVLFVGYSHEDTVMHYLAQALPKTDSMQRFAFKGGKEKTDWNRLGIVPVEFEQATKDDYSQLNEAVSGLAAHHAKNALDWKTKIQSLASNPPPVDRANVSVLQRQLKQETMVEAFVQTATDPAWITWLDKEKFLGALFQGQGWDARTGRFAVWLARTFAAQHPQALWNLFAKHYEQRKQRDLQLQLSFWDRLADQVCKPATDEMPNTLFQRWMIVLLATTPADLFQSQYALLQIAKCCAQRKIFSSLVEVFKAMLAHGASMEGERLDLPFKVDHYNLNEVWEKCLKPHLEHTATSLVPLLVTTLSQRHASLSGWGVPNDDPGREFWDSECFIRSGIEAHEQDRHPKQIDVLIDALRDSLAWVAKHHPIQAAGWCEHLVHAAAPLLRRLALHTTILRTDLTADQKLEWLLGLNNVDLFSYHEHHEVYQLAKHAYPNAGKKVRLAFLSKIDAYVRPYHDDNADEKEKNTQRKKYDWLHWLHAANPSCAATKERLDVIQRAYPIWVPRDWADLRFWMGRLQSPPPTFTAEVLLSKPARDWLPELLAYQGRPEQPFKGDKYDLHDAITEAAKQKPDWGNDLAKALAQGQHWQSDLWGALMQTWETLAEDKTTHAQLLGNLSANAALYEHHARKIAALFLRLVKSVPPIATDLLPKAYFIAQKLWEYAEKDEKERGQISKENLPSFGNWVTHAINHPGGDLAEFWILSLAQIFQQQTKPTSLPPQHSHAFTAMLKSRTSAGDAGRTLLAARIYFLLSVDKEWTTEYLLPLFTDEDDRSFQQAWAGFCFYGRLSPNVCEQLAIPIQSAIKRFKENRPERFTTRYVDFIAHYVDEPIKTWIPTFFEHTPKEQWLAFAQGIIQLLRFLSPEVQQEWWTRWLKPYWNNRLQGVPKRLEEAEIVSMLLWPLHLTAVCGEAVDLAVQMPIPASLGLRHHFYMGQEEVKPLLESHPNELAKLMLHLLTGEKAGMLMQMIPETVESLLKQPNLALENKIALQEHMQC